MMAPSTIVMISMRLIAKESKQPMMFLLNGTLKHAANVSMVLIKLVSPVVNTSHANLVITSINLMIMFLTGNLHAAAGFLLVVGNRAAIIKMIIQDAVQRSGNRDGTIAFSKVPGLLINHAKQILGGLWSAGVGSWSYNGANMAEGYVIYVENYMIHLFRASSGGYAKVCSGGYVQLLQEEC